ncbi:MAG: SIR2 family NAD-dependent protein deacylase [Planctomycetota bacterium]|jgi:NAD-dependent deacetylase
MIDLHDFERVVFFTGAGLSAESGIPTYRGRGGIWHKYNYEDYACQRAFDRDPEKVWDFHDERRRMIGAAEPNEGHRVIAEVQEARPGTWIVTQNIDGLHQRAGATDVIELHGSMWRVRCATCQKITDNVESPLGSRRCACGTYLRPDIVWFEDPLDAATIRAAEKAIATCDLLVSVGTSGVVFPAAELPRLAVERGAASVEINPEETVVSAWYQHHLRGKASEMLRQLWPGR